MYHALCFVVRFNFWNPVQQAFTSVIHLSATDTLWIASGHEWQTLFSFHIIRGLEGKLRCLQNHLPRCVQTWPSFQKAVDVWVSGLFSKHGAVSPLNKSFLLLNNLYSWDVPSHKGLAFKIWPEFFSILLGENRRLCIVWPHTNAFVAKESIIWWMDWCGGYFFQAVLSLLQPLQFHTRLSPTPFLLPSELQHITLDGSHISVWESIVHLPSPHAQPFLVQNNRE